MRREKGCVLRGGVGGSHHKRTDQKRPKIVRDEERKEGYGFLEVVGETKIRGWDHLRSRGIS